MPLALNVFQTITKVVTTTPEEVYTSPIGYTSVILLSQISNIGQGTETATVIHRRGAVDTELLNNYPIESNDTVSVFSGKFVLESGDKLVLFGSNNNNLKFVASILETLS